MRLQSKIICALPWLACISILTPQDAKAEIPACTHGTALLQNDAQAWLTLQSQLTRLKANVTRVRDEISEVIDINDDVGDASDTANKIHKTLSLISPLFELAPSLQSGLDKTARAAEISHKNVLGPVHKVTNAVVTDGRLHEIKAEIEANVLPKIALMEKDASTAHLKSVTIGKDYVEACHVAATLKSAACISSGNRDIQTIYNNFNKPVSTLDTVVLDAAKGIGEANRIMETSLSVSFNPLLDIRAPVLDISKAIKDLEHEIDKLEKFLEKYIHIHFGGLNLKFKIKDLLKEWKAELKKLEHLVDIDKLKAEMRKAVEKVLRPIVQDIEKFIHSLEHSLTPPGLDLSKLEADLKAFEKMLAFNRPHVDLTAIEKAIKDMENAIKALESCK